MFSPASPITGAAVTGLTSPTHTLTVDAPPAPYAKQWAITSLGGTQTGVVSSSASKPFTLSAFRPQVLRALPPLNTVSGQLASAVPMNVYKFIGRKGVVPLANQPARVALARFELEVPAGSETADTNSLASLVSMVIGALWAQASGIVDTATTGVL